MATTSPETTSKGALEKGLGLWSLGLGLTQVLAPDRHNALIGVRTAPQDKAVTRSVGLRELACAAGILTRQRPVGFLWSRVAGDALDLAALGRVLRDRSEPRPRRTALAAAAVAGAAAADVVAAVRTSRAGDHKQHKARRSRAVAAITVNAPLVEVEAAWLAYVIADPKEPAEAAVLTEAPGGRGTEVRVAYDRRTGTGLLKQVVDSLHGDTPKQQIEDALRRFKQLVETGEVVKSEAMPDGVDAGHQLRQRPAQPLGTRSETGKALRNAALRGRASSDEALRSRA